MKSFFVLFLITVGFISCKEQAVITNDKNMNDSILKDYARYNLWANKQFITWLENASEEQLNQEIESSFSTIRSTLIHLWGAEHGWLTALQETPWGRPYAGEEFEGSNTELMQGFKSTTELFTDFVLQLSDAEFTEIRTRGEGKPEDTVEEIILHVFNHATFHRGQLVTLGRQVGLKQPPRTDYIYYIREIR